MQSLTYTGGKQRSPVPTAVTSVTVIASGTSGEATSPIRRAPPAVC
ncbi:MAG TPA: hypothetical protein VHS56_08955 [Candidatus Cybelea sp.]|nr:hypothetical protein [Candidatus Cybelea sp.]